MAKSTLYDGKFLQVVRKGNWEFAKRKKICGIVGIVAVTDDQKLILVEQFRPPVGKTVVELPAGLAGDSPSSRNEDLAIAARRELLEETGYTARKMTRLVAGAVSAGMTDEVVTLFRATGLTKTGAGEGDGSEQITTHLVPLKSVKRWLARQEAAGKLVDMKVYAGLHFAD